MGCLLHIILHCGPAGCRPDNIKIVVGSTRKLGRAWGSYLKILWGVRLHRFLWFQGFVDGWVNSTRAKDVAQNLPISRRVWTVVNENVTVRLLSFSVEGCHESLTVLVKNVFRNNANLFPVTRAAEKGHTLSITTDIGVKFSLWKHILKQKYDTGFPMASLSEEARNDGALYRFRN